MNKYDQAETSRELDAKEAIRIKGHFDRVRDALESTSDPECSRFMRHTKIEQALVSIDQLVLDWRANRLAARPAPTTEKAFREALEKISSTPPTASMLNLSAKVSDPDWFKFANNHQLIARAALLAHEAPKEGD